MNVASSSPARAISDLYTFALGIGAMVAFGIIVYAAFRYATSESSSTQSEAKTMIYQALLGLLLLLGVTLVLRFIDPELPNLRDPDLKRLDPVYVITPPPNTSFSYWALKLCPVATCTNPKDQLSYQGKQYTSKEECEVAHGQMVGGPPPENWRCVGMEPVPIPTKCKDGSQPTPVPAPTPGPTPGPGSPPPTNPVCADGSQPVPVPAPTPGGPVNPPSETQCTENPECVQAVSDLRAAGITVRSSRNCYDWERGCTSLIGSAVPGIVSYLKELQTACQALVSSCRLTVTGATEPGHKSHSPDKAIVDLSPEPGISNFIYAQIGTRNPTAYRWYKDKSRDFYYFWETSPAHWHICFSVTYCNQAGDLTRGQLPRNSEDNEE